MRLEGDPKDHLVQSFLAKARSRQDGSAPCTDEFQKCPTLGNSSLPWGDCFNSFSSLSTAVFPSWVDPSLCYTPGLHFPRCKILFGLIRSPYPTLSACPGFPAGWPPFQSLQFGLIGKCHQGTSDPIFHVIYECSKQRWAQCLSLGIHTCDRSPVWNRVWNQYVWCSDQPLSCPLHRPLA